jgi:hypothetical protein
VNGGDCLGANVLLTAFDNDVRAAGGAAESSGTSEASAFSLRGSCARIDHRRSPTADGAAEAAFNAEEGEVNGGDCLGASGVLTGFDHDVCAADGASESSGTSQASAYSLRGSYTRIDHGRSPTADDPADVAFNAEEGEVNGGDYLGASAVRTATAPRTPRRGRTEWAR